jgi:PilZ domain-containing protein
MFYRLEDGSARRALSPSASVHRARASFPAGSYWRLRLLTCASTQAHLGHCLLGRAHFDLVTGGLPAPASSVSFTSSPRAARASDSAPPSSPSPTTSVLTLAAAPEKTAAPRVNRRKYPWIRVNYIALVRHPERGEEFVQCEDVSRGGLRFKSTSRYVEQTLIEVAAPYSSGQPAIFVPARIVYVQELPEQNLFRYGAEYLITIKSRASF